MDASLDFLRAREPDPPVTVIREIRVRPGSEAHFEDSMARLIEVAKRQPGHLGATVIRPDPHRPGDAYRFVYKFERRSLLQDWHGGAARAELFAPIEPLIDSDRFDEFEGLESWFDLPGVATPPRWKTTLMSWAAIYTLVVLASYALEALGFDGPIPVRALLLTGVVVPLVSYVVAPWLGRRLHAWLFAGSLPRRAKRVRE